MKKGLSFAQQGAQIAQQVRGAGQPAPTAPPQAATPPVAEPAPSPEPTATPEPAPPVAPVAPAAPVPSGTPTAAPAQADALGLLRLILTNPQFQQTLHLASSMGTAGPRAVSLPVPVATQPDQQRDLRIPLGAVMNAIVLLARQSMTDLNATTREDEPSVPEYLVDEHGEYLVNPTDPQARASLVAEWFQVSEQAELAAEYAEAHDETDVEIDEAEAWAEDAGFTM